MHSPYMIPEWLEQFGWVLIHLLWEGMLIGMIAWLILALLKRASAHLRYLILCAALLCCGLAPCVTWVSLHKSVQNPRVLMVEPKLEIATHSDPNFTETVIIATSSLGKAITSYQPWNRERLVTLIHRGIPFCVAFWTIGVILLSLRLLYGWLELRKLCASGVPLKDQNWVVRFDQLADRMGIRHTILLLESVLVEVPTVIGWLRPMVLLPATFFTGLSPDQIEAILAHELAHIRRHDYLVNLVQIGIETLLFYHPVVWWLSRSTREERENCCDDLALQVVGDKLIYATALASLEESRSLTMAITLAATGGSLLQRIKRLLGASEGKPFPWPLFLLLVVVLAAGAFAFSSSFKGRSTAPTRETKDANKPELKSLVIKVQDEQGLPIEGATIIPTDLRVIGRDYGWDGENAKLPPLPIKTDAKGEASLPYPLQIRDQDLLSVEAVGFAITHPLYCSVRTELQIDQPQPVTLHRGMQLVIAQQAPVGINLSGLYVNSRFADYKSGYTRWSRGSDGTVSAIIPQSKLLVRAVAFGANDSVYFSPPELIEPTASGTKSIMLNVKLGTTLEGVLDASVPRPIKKGVVIAVVSTSALSTNLALTWWLSADIRDDGSFTLPFLPSGNLEIIAVCDGYVSKDPKSKGDRFRNAQSLPFDSSHPLIVTMDQTGSARVLVKDPSGHPLPAATVGFFPMERYSLGAGIIGQTFYSANTLKQRQDHPDVSWWTDNSKPPSFSAKTSASGEAIIKNLPSGEQHLSVVSTNFEQPIPPHAYGNSAERDHLVDIKSGQESTVTVIMEAKGLTSLEEAKIKANGQAVQNGSSGGTNAPNPVEGIVTDEKGNPLAGIDVSYDEIANGPSVHPITKTDGKGYFRFLGLPERASKVSHFLIFVSKDFAPELVELGTVTPGKSLHVVMKEGKRLKVHFVDKQGNSVPNVWMHLVYWAGHSMHEAYKDIEFHSDTNGIVTWDHAPEGVVMYQIGKNGFQSICPSFAPKDEVQIYQVYHPTVVTGRVQDAVTKKPITDYQLVPGRLYPNNHELNAWEREFAKHIQGESYSYLFPKAEEIGGNEGHPVIVGFHRIRIDVPGYETGVSQPIANDEEAVSIDFELKPAVATHGTVSAANGSPVKSAKIIMISNGVVWMDILNGDYKDYKHLTTLYTDDNGNYELPSEDEDYPIVIFQPDAGYLTTTYAQLKSVPNVQLLPWGQIHLTSADAKSLIPKTDIGGEMQKIRFDCDAPEKEADGSLLYRHLASGPVWIGVTTGDFDNGTFHRTGAIVNVEGGKTLEVDWVALKLGKLGEAKSLSNGSLENLSTTPAPTNGVTTTNAPSAQSTTPIKQIKFSSKFLYISPPLDRLADPALAFLGSLTNTNNPPLILSASEMEAAMKALNHRKGVELVSAPAVTTRAGKEGWVKIVQQCSYPTDWDRVEKGWKGKNFKNLEVGISLVLLGNILPDSSCEINLEPKVVKLNGYTDLDNASGTHTDGLRQGLLTSIEESNKYIAIFGHPPNGHRLKPEFTEYARSVQVTTKPGQTVAFLTPGVQPRRPDSNKPNDEKYLIVFVTLEEVKMDSPPTPVPFSTVTSTNR